jgi:hypothetical protein
LSIAAAFECQLLLLYGDIYDRIQLFVPLNTSQPISPAFALSFAPQLLIDGFAIALHSLSNVRFLFIAWQLAGDCFLCNGISIALWWLCDGFVMGLRSLYNRSAIAS